MRRKQKKMRKANGRERRGKNRREWNETRWKMKQEKKTGHEERRNETGYGKETKESRKKLRKNNGTESEGKK